MDERVDFVIRTVLNLAAPAEALDIEDWDLVASLRRVFARYSPINVEFRGVRSGIPEVLVLNSRSAPGTPAYCVFTDSHYSISVVLKELAVQAVSHDQRVWAAYNVFLRLAGDYLLQLGALGDATRLHCASWRTSAGDEALGPTSGIFETFFTNPVFEHVLVEGGWPLAHELGHTVANQNAEVTSMLADWLDVYTRNRFGDRGSAWGPPGSREKLLDELSADWFGAEILLRAIGGRGFSMDEYVVLFGEFAACARVMMLMETCKEVVRLVCTAPDTARDVVERAGNDIPWMYEARTEFLFRGIKADLHTAFESAGAVDQLNQAILMANDAFAPNWQDILVGLLLAQKTLVEGPLIEGIDATGAEEWDRQLFHLMPIWVGRSPYIQVAVREFVNRARVTHNYRNQRVDLLNHLDRLVPKDSPQLARPRHSADQIDIPNSNLSKGAGH